MLEEDTVLFLDQLRYPCEAKLLFTFNTPKRNICIKSRLLSQFAPCTRYSNRVARGLMME